MLIQLAPRRCSAALAAASLLFSAAPIRRQAQSRLYPEIAGIRTGNADTRDELRKREGRNTILLEQMPSLKRVCNGKSLSVTERATKPTDAAPSL
jgi:hypothetical protein